MKKLLIPSLVTAVLAVVMAFQAHTPETIVTEPPEVALTELPGHTSEELSPSEAELTVLPADTVISKRLYTGEDGHWFAVSAVVGGKTKNSIHRPELCLPTQGFLMTNPRTRTIGETPWRVITLDGGVSRPSCSFAYTFFNQAGYHTSSHTARIFRDVWDRSLNNRIDRWVMITVFSSQSNEEIFADFLAQLKGVTE